MCLDNFKEGFTNKEVKDIRRRILEGIPQDSDEEQDFLRFFEEIRKKAELYSLIMFQGAKILKLNLKDGYVVIRDKNGEQGTVNLAGD